MSCILTMRLLLAAGLLLSTAAHPKFLVGSEENCAKTCAVGAQLMGTAFLDSSVGVKVLRDGVPLASGATVKNDGGHYEAVFPDTDDCEFLLQVADQKLSLVKKAGCKCCAGITFAENCFEVID